jgi:hypothetical protein
VVVPAVCVGRTMAVLGDTRAEMLGVTTGVGSTTVWCWRM